MAKTKIEWTDFTVNFWEGCQKVGPGCDNCYAEARDVRFTGGSHWGPGAPRRKVKNGIPNLNRINRKAAAFLAEHGRFPRVFCSSLSDVFDNAVHPEWRKEAFEAVECAGFTSIQLLTKRIGNVGKMVPLEWVGFWPQHVGLMITVVNQDEANRDIPKLLDLKARLDIPWVGLSMEPLLGAISLSLLRVGPRGSGRVVGDTYDALTGEAVDSTDRGYVRSQGGEKLDWVIVGGESGPNARPMHPDWARSLRDQCEAAGTAFFFKQWGEWQPISEIGDDKIEALHHPAPVSRPDATERCKHDSICLDLDGTTYSLGTAGKPVCCPAGAFAGPKPMSMFRVGKASAGRLLDGREWNGVPG